MASCICPSLWGRWEGITEAGCELLKVLDLDALLTGPWRPVAGGGGGLVCLEGWGRPTSAPAQLPPLSWGALASPPLCPFLFYNRPTCRKDINLVIHIGTQLYGYADVSFNEAFVQAPRAGRPVTTATQAQGRLASARREGEFPLVVVAPRQAGGGCPRAGLPRQTGTVPGAKERSRPLHLPPPSQSWRRVKAAAGPRRAQSPTPGGHRHPPPTAPGRFIFIQWSDIFTSRVFP